jgi:hypothetical protein
MTRSIISIFVLGCCASLVSAQTEPGSGVQPFSFTREGLVFDASIGPYVSSADKKSNDNYLFSLSAGYLFAKQISVGLRIYTGSDRLTNNTAPLQHGFFAVGGGDIEGVVYVGSGDRWRPFLSAAVGLITVTQWGSGYNGHDARLGGGMQFVLSRFFGVNMKALYGYRRFYNLVNQTDLNNLFAPYTEHTFEMQVSFSFYPNILP